MIDSGREAARAIELFARCCERLNEFARDLREQKRFGDVRTHADIRYYADGWRLEKSVEADLAPADGHIVAWCIELARVGDEWRVASSANASHSEIYRDLGDRMASSVAQLERALDEATVELISMAERDSEFCRAVERLSVLR